MRHITRSQLMKGLAGHVKVIKFYSKVNGDFLKDLKQSSDLFYS